MNKILRSKAATAVLGAGVVGGVVALFAGVAGAVTPTASAETTSLITAETGQAFPVVMAIALGLVGITVFVWAVHRALGVFKSRGNKV